MELKGLRDKTEEALRRLEKCNLCPRNCGVNRRKDEPGYCRIGREAKVASFGPHFGEEPELVGKYGSGTIFFSSCNLRCLFCQNYSISHLGEGRQTSTGELAEIMLALERQGCHNINLVTPSHVVAQILEGLLRARRRGLRLPVVYNTGGYDSLETLKLLEGEVDIYMPDAKYADERIAGELSDVPDYPQVAREALKEMHRQVGDLVVDKEGIARRGLLIRHLVLPEGLAGTEEVLSFIAGEISPDSYVNIMDQYRPCWRGVSHSQVNRPLTPEEYRQALAAARKVGLHRDFS